MQLFSKSNQSQQVGRREEKKRKEKGLPSKANVFRIWLLIALWSYRLSPTVAALKTREKSEQMSSNDSLQIKPSIPGPHCDPGGIRFAFIKEETRNNIFGWVRGVEVATKNKNKKTAEEYLQKGEQLCWHVLHLSLGISIGRDEENHWLAKHLAYESDLFM